MKTSIATLLLASCLCTSPLLAQNETSIGPVARWGHVFVYNQAKDHILLFGGAPERGKYIDDTWIWDGEKWESILKEGPAARGFCAASYHEERKSIIIHGGRGNGNVTYSDTWEWDGTKWTKINEEGPFKADHHEMVYTSSEKKMVAFGGWNGQGVLGDTWVWDGKWEKLDAESPPPRSAFGMVYNKKEKKIKLHGGLWINGQYADTWEWSKDLWSSIGGPYDNSSIDHHAMIYDEKSEQVLIFGGKDYRYKMKQNLLAIEGQTISLITNEGPSARHSIGFTVDNEAGITYLYGGKKYEGEVQIPLGDFWRWNGEKWEEIR